MLWGAEKLVPAEYWCPYGSPIYKHNIICLKGGFVVVVIQGVITNFFNTLAVAYP